MGGSLFGIEAELAVSASARGRVIPVVDLAGALLRVAERTLVHLRGSGSRFFLSNGGLLYVDCGHHPEFATPECTTPAEAVCHLTAGQRTLTRLATLAGGELGADAVQVCRTNVDYLSGTTWGCHESYLGRRPVSSYSTWLIPHLVSRIVYTGSGGLDPLTPGIRFSISPRVAHIKHVVSPESTAARGIFHTRDEPLCNGYSRIHVLAGDNACSQRATWLKMGTTALVVALADAEPSEAPGIRLADPVGAMKGFARDPGYRTPVQSKRGSRELMTATQIQRHLLSSIEACVGRPHFPDWAAAVCAAWKQTLDLVETPAIQESHALDWPLKFGLFRREIARSGFTEPEIATWSDVLERLSRPAPADCERVLHLDRARIELLRDTGALTGADLAAAERTLAAHGLSWRSVDEFNALRRALCAIDVRFGELGHGIFESLDRLGEIPDHRVVTEVEIDAAARRAPAATRAAARGYWVEQLAGRRRRYTCDWNGIAGARLRLDLGDPFATKGKWARTRLGLEDAPGPTPPLASETAHPLVEAVQRAVATGNTAGALTRARAALDRNAALPLGACAALLRALDPLLPDCPRPIIAHDPEAIEAVLLGIGERARRFQDPCLEDAVATPLFRLYEGIGRYDRARSVLAARLEAASRGRETPVSGSLINNHAYEDLLEGQYGRAAAGFARAQAAFERDGGEGETANVRANILTCRFAMLPPGRWRELLPELRCVNRLLYERRDWRTRKTLMLLARHAEARGRRAAAIGWARRAVRAAAGIATRHRVEDEAYLRSLEAGETLVGQPAVD